MPAHPLLFIIMNNSENVEKEVTYSIRQPVACKYLNLRLVSSVDKTPQANIDLYSLGLKGVPLDFC